MTSQPASDNGSAKARVALAEKSTRASVDGGPHPGYQHVQAPLRPASLPHGSVAVFLGGSTAMLASTGSWYSWRGDIAAALDDLPVVVLDPYRADWDSTWREAEDDDRFVDQVLWELEMQERADLLVVVFAPGTKAPVSLLEMGMRVGQVRGDETRRGSKLVVVCSDEFWKAGNVRIVCKRFGIPCLSNVEDLEATLRTRVYELSQ